MSEVPGFVHAVGHGSTWHARLSPKEHRFQYRTAMVLLDLDRLADFQGSMLAVNRLSVLSFKTHWIDNIIC